MSDGSYGAHRVQLWRQGQLGLRSPLQLRPQLRHPQEARPAMEAREEPGHQCGRMSQGTSGDSRRCGSPSQPRTFAPKGVLWTR